MKIIKLILPIFLLSNLSIFCPALYHCISDTDCPSGYGYTCQVGKCVQQTYTM